MVIAWSRKFGENEKFVFIGIDPSFFCLFGRYVYSADEKIP